jgi:uncharacterized protein
MWRAVITLMFVMAAQMGQAQCRDDAVYLRGDWGSVKFNIELADTVRERSRGLMFRENLPPGDGMLFVYDKPGRVSFWMKNTLIPLDMIFMDVQGTVVQVHDRAKPGDLTPIFGGDNVFAVLEINGGLARRYGIAAGTQMRHQVFSRGPAIWPC